MSSQEKIMGAGKALYMLNIPNVEIARTLDVSETTVSNWVKKGDWREERLKDSNLKRTIRDRLYKMIDYQLDVMDNFVDTQRSAGTLTSLDKGQIYALRQMLINTSDDQFEFATVVSIIRQVVEHISITSPALAKQITPLTDELIRMKREQLSV